MQTLEQWLTEQEQELDQYAPDESMGIERRPLRIALKIIRALTELAGEYGALPRAEEIAQRIINEEP